MIKAPIFILNAPKRVGKDTVAMYMETYCGDIRKASFKDPLYNLFLATTGMDQHAFYEKYEESGWKDTPNEMLNGKSPRELLIHISETYIKPFFGKDYFGKTLSQMIQGAEEVSGEVPWVIPDGGFNEEIEAMYETFGNRIVVVQFTRDGYCDFSGDSRDWVTFNGPTYYKGFNDGLNGSHDLAIKILRHFGLLDFEPVL